MPDWMMLSKLLSNIITPEKKLDALENMEKLKIDPKKRSDYENIINGTKPKMA